jgi:hypothetical protein
MVRNRQLIRSFRHDDAAALCAFDLPEVDGRDLRRLPIELRKAGLARLLHKPSPGVAFKVKNPAAPAVRREAEEDWGRNAGRRDAKFDVPLCSRQRRKREHRVTSPLGQLRTPRLTLGMRY